ncbi:hypothetical protein Trydic_g7922 [Trypoxylus dichotomus]
MRTACSAGDFCLICSAFRPEIFGEEHICEGGVLTRLNRGKLFVRLLICKFCIEHFYSGNRVNPLSAAEQSGLYVIRKYIIRQRQKMAVGEQSGSSLKLANIPAGEEGTRTITKVMDQYEEEQSILSSERRELPSNK